MNDIPQQPQNELPPRRATWIARVFSFRSSAVVAVLSLTALFVWPTIDASYRYASGLAKINLGFETIVAAHPAVDAAGITDMMLSIANQWDRLGIRVKLLYLLYLAAMVSTASILFSCIRCRSATRIAFTAGLACCWVALVTTRSPIEHWSIQRQALSVLPGFEVAAVELTKNWPTQSTRIPPDVEVIVAPKRYPDVLIVQRRRPYPMREDFGPTIERSNNGTIRFSLRGAYDCNIEYHPAGSLPATYVNAFGNPSSKVAAVNKLKDSWYLVQYGEN